MANPTDDGPFRAELLHERVGALLVAAVAYRRGKDPRRAALIYATLRSSEVTERALAWTLEAGAAATGDPEAGRCALRVARTPTATQRLAAVSVLQQREQRITPVQRIAVVDAAARWLAEDAGEELAQALLQAACTQPTTASFAYLALIDRPGAGK